MIQIRTSRRLLAAALLAAALGAGCATVQPWQRGTLADQCMIMDGNANLV